MISGSPWFQYQGNHSATYNVLKSVVNLGNRITLVYPTKNHEIELDNAAKIMKDASAGLSVIPVDIRPHKIARCYQSGRRILDRYLTKPDADIIRSQFADYMDRTVRFNKSFIRAIERILRKEAYDVIQVDYPAALKAIGFLGTTGLPKVFINHEIQAIRAERTLRLEKDSFTGIIQKVRDVESHFLKKYDAVIALTLTDSEKLDTLYGIDSHVSPHAVDTGFWHKKNVNPDRLRLVFSGGESHYPNRDAAQWLCRDIVPLLEKKLKDFHIYIIGRWSERTRMKFASDRIVFTGYVHDMRDYLSGGISLAPLRIGSGMRIKILEAMALGCAVVTTSVGCEGLGTSDGVHLCTADSAGEFAQKTIMIANNPGLYDNLGAAARKFVVDNFSVEIAGKRRVAVLKRILKAYHLKYRTE